MVAKAVSTETPERSAIDEDARRIQREKNQEAIDLFDAWLNETDPEVIRSSARPSST